MVRLTARLLRAFRSWDRPTQIAFITALVLLLITLLLAAFGPANLRQLALIGVGGLVIIMQIILMWANRGMVTSYTRAQRAFMNGDFESVRALLESVRATGKADMRDLTLLGNTYRQLGELEASKEALTEALRLRPNHHFPLYGFGRTLLVQGHYAEAIEAISRALEAGAPSAVRFDLGDACFRQGLWEDASAALEGIRPLIEEPHRALMADYMLHRLEQGEPPSPLLVEAGLPYWRAEAERFRHTPYGQALADDVRQLQRLGGGRADV